MGTAPFLARGIPIFRYRTLWRGGLLKQYLASEIAYSKILDQASHCG
jgi:hypothetical protein